MRSPSAPQLPAGSGFGRRIVNSNPLQRMWLVGSGGQVERTYLVSGRQGRPADGRLMQTEDDLGGYRSAGCVRQSPVDAAFLWDWTGLGATVVVVY